MTDTGPRPAYDDSKTSWKDCRALWLTAFERKLLDYVTRPNGNGNNSSVTLLDHRNARSFMRDEGSVRSFADLMLLDGDYLWEWACAFRAKVGDTRVAGKEAAKYLRELRVKT